MGKAIDIMFMGPSKEIIAPGSSRVNYGVRIKHSLGWPTGGFTRLIELTYLLWKENKSLFSE